MTTSLWQAAELASVLNISVDDKLAVSGVSIDTRTLVPGDLYFAIKGDALDGHDFVPQAFEKGAVAAVVTKERAQEFQGLGTLLIVPDVLAALGMLGKASRKRSNAYIVAVTGSVGKTSTKEMLRFALEKKGKTHASVASYNNHWGVPLTLARMPRDTRYGVFEIGMNHEGEIRPLVQMVRPHCAIITTVAPVHLEFFASVAAIVDAKSEIFSTMEPGGVAILNVDNPYFERMKAQGLAQSAARVVSFGENEKADIRADKIHDDEHGSDVSAHVFGKAMTYHLGIPGRHMALNSLAVLAVLREIDAHYETVAQHLSQISAPKGRGARESLKIRDGHFILIDESYNANPASMRAALLALGKTPVSHAGKRIAVLAPMRELGPTGAELHHGLAASIEEAGVDCVYLAGDLMENLYKALPEHKKTIWVGHARELIEPLCAALSPGDVVMIKGSLSTQMGLVVKGLQAHFPG